MMQKRSNRILFLLLLLISALSACDNKKVYDKFVHTPLAGWEKNDSLVFTIPKIKDTGEYILSLQMRTNNSFPFMNVVLIADRKIIPKGTSSSDTLICHLSDNKGNSLGTGINIYQYRFHVNSLRLDVGDSLRITIRHDMKREILPGISDIGMTLSRK